MKNKNNSAVMKSDSVQKIDSFINEISNVGVRGKDKKEAAYFSENLLKQIDLDAIFQTNDIAKKIVSLLPYDMTREGFEVKSSDDAFNEFIEKEFENLDIETQITDCMRTARHYGGAILYFNFDDGLKQDEPFDINKIKKINFVRSLGRYELNASDIEMNVFKKNFRKPNFYEVNSSSNTGLKIHYSRVLRFDGNILPWSTLQRNNYWHDSVLADCYDRIKNYDGALDLTRSIMEEFIRKIIKLKDLTALINANKMDLVKARLELFDYQMSILKTCVLQDGDEFTTQQTTFTGIPEIIKSFKERMVGASNMPHTKLFGTGPDGGIGATGNSEIRDWYDVVKQNQEQIYRPALKWIIDIMKTYAKKDSVDYNICFKPLWQPTRKEDLEARKIVTDIDAINIDRGVYTAEEAATSHYTDQGFADDIKLDTVTRAKMETTVADPNYSPDGEDV